MNPSPDYVLTLLQKIGSVQVETFKNFPEVFRAGNHQLEKEDVDFLCCQGYLIENKSDSFGRYLYLSEQAKALLLNKE